MTTLTREGGRELPAVKRESDLSRSRMGRVRKRLVSKSSHHALNLGKVGLVCWDHMVGTLSR